MKAAWELLWAKADPCGVWKINHRLAEFQIGKKVDWLAFLTRTESRLIQLDKYRYLFVQFVKVNCGNLSKECKAHSHVFSALDSNKLSYESAAAGLLPGSYEIATLKHIEEEEDKEIEEEKDIKEGMQGEVKPLTDLEVFVTAWNALPTPFARIRNMSPKRVETWRVRMKTDFWASNWRQAIQTLPDLQFCRGENDRGWVADVDFFLTPDAVTKIIEGKYANKPNGKHAAAEALHKTANPEHGW